MASTSAVQGTSLSDLYTRIIPGFILALPFLLGFTIMHDIQPSALIDPTVVLLILTTFLFIGEVINHLRKSLGDAPRHFGRVLFDGKNIWYLHFRDRIRTEEGRTGAGKVNSIAGRLAERIFGPPDSARAPVFASNNIDFQDTLSKHFSVDLEETSPNEIYHMFIRHLESNFPMETRRRHHFYIMTANLKIAISLVLTGGTGVVVVVSIVSAIPFARPPVLWSTVAILMLFLSPFYISALAYLSDNSRNFVNASIAEYYYDRCSTNYKPISNLQKAELNQPQK